MKNKIMSSKKIECFLGIGVFFVKFFKINFDVFLLNKYLYVLKVNFLNCYFFFVILKVLKFLLKCYDSW